MHDLTNPVLLLQKLIQCPSVTPHEAGALDMLQSFLADMNFSVERPIFKDIDTPDVENLYARLGDNGPHLMFAGHTDVVPVGDKKLWNHLPFAATIEDGKLYGRGTVDMKGGIACFIAALNRYLKNNVLKGSVSFLITGDEEGPAINGTVKLLQWAAKKGETWDGAIVGEPTNPNALGDMIKIGRRGSLSATLKVFGKQGHVAYPDRAANPMPYALELAKALIEKPLDSGTNNFQPSNLEITAINTDNTATNVIASDAIIRFNIRYNDVWNSDTLKTEIHQRLAQAQSAFKPKDGLSFQLHWINSPGGVFLTKNDKLIDTLTTAIQAITNKTPELSTSGGTSDARFIKDYCPVVEFGLVGQTMHMTDEHVAIADLEMLTSIYERFISDYFA